MNAALATCAHCQDKRQVWNQWAGGFIRCVKCTQPPRKPDRRAFDQLNAAAAERREQRAIDVQDPTKYTGLACTVDLLYQWGRMVRDHGIGFPPMAATEKARIGRGGGQDLNTPFPPDLEAVDRAVTRAPIDYKTVLVEHYTKFGYITEKAAHLGISRETYYKRRAAGERHIANELGV